MILGLFLKSNNFILYLGRSIYCSYTVKLKHKGTDFSHVAPNTKVQYYKLFYRLFGNIVFNLKMTQFDGSSDNTLVSQFDIELIKKHVKMLLQYKTVVFFFISLK